MRIARVRIGSFGALRERDYELDSDLAVFYGPNEAGKSTVKSFITGTIFDKPHEKNAYPSKESSDSGTVDAIMSDGSARTFKRSGKRGESIAAAAGITEDEYRKIYSLDPEDLRDTKIIDEGDIRNRFLVIPGANDLSKAMEDLDKERTALLPDLRRSKDCRLSSLRARSEELRDRIAELKSKEGGDDAYNALVKRRSELETAEREASAKLPALQEKRDAANINERQKATREKIRALKEQESGLAYSERADETRAAERDRLRGDLTSKREARMAAARCLEDRSKELRGRDPGKILRHGEDIRRLYREVTFYARARQSAMPPALPAEPVPQPSEKPMIPMATAAACMVIGALASAAGQLMIGLALIAAGCIAGAIIRLLAPKAAPRAAAVRPEAKTDEGVAKQIAEDEALLKAVAEDIGIPRRTFADDVESLESLLSAAEGWRAANAGCAEARARESAAQKLLDAFYSGFGGEAAFDKALGDRRALLDIRSRRRALEESVRDSPEASVDLGTASEEYGNAQKEKDGITSELATVRERIAVIESDRSVDAAAAEASEAESAVYRAVGDWARLMLETLILKDAVDAAYSEHAPAVIDDADRFLASMTGGRYRVCAGPCDGGIRVIDTKTGEKKYGKEWSTGLGDQVRLAMKMAIALLLSAEYPPMILDDVLLTSDTERKRGGCRAIRELSKSLQVIYFTCDRETRDLMEAEGARILPV